MVPLSEEAVSWQMLQDECVKEEQTSVLKRRRQRGCMKRTEGSGTLWSLIPAS